MKNEVRIKPLLEYTVTLVNTGLRDSRVDEDVFTGDTYEVRDGRTIFYRTGNVVREYPRAVAKIVVKPVDDA